MHGYGFAGALSEIGLPQDDLAQALLGFNLGVEVGQLLFVFAVLVLWSIFSRLQLAGRYSGQQRGFISTTVFGYAIGGVSAYWVVERIAGFVL